MRALTLVAVLAIGFVANRGLAATRITQCHEVAKLATPVHKYPAPEVREAPKNLDELTRAFSEGFIADLNDPAQREAFETYRRLKLGDPNTDLPQNALRRVAEIQKANPEIGKIPFRSIATRQQRKIYPPIRELTQLAEKVNRRMSNIAYEMGDYVAGFVGKEAARELLQFNAGQMKSEETLNEFVERIFKLSLAHYRELAPGDPQRASWANLLSSLTHTYALGDPLARTWLGGKNGQYQTRGLGRAMGNLEDLAVRNGFEKGYAELHELIAGGKPDLLAEGGSLDAVNQRARAELVRAEKGKLPVEETERRVRPLSWLEAFFRSCVGGSDCSSRTYLEKAAQENYHYFTFTTPDGRSDSQATIVLGETQVGGKKIPIAFVDKIQNVEPQDLPAFLEGIRRSVAEEGYRLALPKDLGDHNGISNVGATRQFLAEYLREAAEPTAYGSFAPAHVEKRFDTDQNYSRAELGLNVTVLKPHTDESATFTPGQKHLPWRAKQMDMGKIRESSFELKRGSAEDKLRYVSLMESLVQLPEGHKLIDPEMKRVFDLWMDSATESDALKKRIILYYMNYAVAGRRTSSQYWSGIPKELFPLFERLPPAAQTDLAQNLWQTPRYREVLEKRPEDASLILRAHAPSLTALLKPLPDDTIFKIWREYYQPWKEEINLSHPYTGNVFRALGASGSWALLRELEAAFPLYLEAQGPKHRSDVQAAVDQMKKRVLVQDIEPTKDDLKRFEAAQQKAEDDAKKPFVASNGTQVQTSYGSIEWKRPDGTAIAQYSHYANSDAPTRILKDGTAVVFKSRTGARLSGEWVWVKEGEEVHREAGTADSDGVSEIAGGRVAFAGREGRDEQTLVVASVGQPPETIKVLKGTWHTATTNGDLYYFDIDRWLNVYRDGKSTKLWQAAEPQDSLPTTIHPVEFPDGSIVTGQPGKVVVIAPGKPPKEIPTTVDPRNLNWLYVIPLPNGDIGLGTNHEDRSISGDKNRRTLQWITNGVEAGMVALDKEFSTEGALTLDDGSILYLNRRESHFRMTPNHLRRLAAPKPYPAKMPATKPPTQP